MLDKLKKLNESVSNLSVTLKGGSALLFYLWMFFLMGQFLIRLIQLTGLLIKHELPVTDRAELFLYYIALFVFIWIIKHTTIHKKN